MAIDVRQQLIHSLKQELKKNPYIGLYQLESFGMNLTEWPEFTEDIERLKPKFIKDALTSLKEGNLGHVDQVLTRLGGIGVKWPELVVIQRSFDAETKDWIDIDAIDEGDMKINMPRSLTADDLSTIRKISALLHKGHVGDALWVSFELPNRLDELHSIFQHYKTTIMKFLLKEVQKGTGTHFLEIVLDGLGRQTITWPELAIVKKTVYSNDYKNI